MRARPGQRRSAALSAALALTWFSLSAESGCSREPPRERAKAERAAPAPAAAAAADAPTDPAPPRVGARGTAIDFNKDPRPPDGDMVVFAVDGALVPLACFIAETGEVAGGDACRARVPEGAELQLVAANTAEAVRRGEERPSRCPFGGQAGVGFAAAPDVLEQHSWGVWPVSGIMLVLHLYGEDMAREPATLDDKTRAAVTSALAGLGINPGGKTLTSRQHLGLDLDGDDTIDHLWALTLDDPGAAAHLWSGVMIVDEATGRARVVEASRGDDYAYAVIGTVDLRGDKRRALWLQRAGAESRGERLVELTDAGPSPLSEWTCPPA